MFRTSTYNTAKVWSFFPVTDHCPSQCHVSQSVSQTGAETTDGDKGIRQATRSGKCWGMKDEWVGATTITIPCQHCGWSAN